MLAMEDDEQDALAYAQRLKAAVHFTVGRICEEVADEEGVQFSLQFIAALAETTFRECQTFGNDLELFAKHAKRTTVNTDDVKLLVRKSEPLHNYICSQITAANADKAAKKPRKRKAPKSSEASTSGQYIVEENGNDSS